MTDYNYKPYFEQRIGTIEPLKEDRAANTWHKVNFDPPFGSDKIVVVIPMTQTYHGIGFRASSIDQTGR